MILVYLTSLPFPIFKPAILDAISKPPTKKKTRRRLRTTSDPINLTPSASKLPEFTPEERRHVIFYQDAGGFQGTDESDRPLPVIYYLGIIDIFTSYNTTKKLEHFFRSITNDSKKISAIRPKKYGERFFKFIQDSLNKAIKV